MKFGRITKPEQSVFETEPLYLLSRQLAKGWQPVQLLLPHLYQHLSPSHSLFQSLFFFQPFSPSHSFFLFHNLFQPFSPLHSLYHPVFPCHLLYQPRHFLWNHQVAGDWQPAQVLACNIFIFLSILFYTHGSLPKLES